MISSPASLCGGCSRGIGKMRPLRFAEILCALKITYRCRQFSSRQENSMPIVAFRRLENCNATCKLLAR